METSFPGELIKQNDRHLSFSTPMSERLDAHEDRLIANSLAHVLCQLRLA